MSETVKIRAEAPTGTTRTYNKWTSNSTLEDYSLRYAPRSFRRKGHRTSWQPPHSAASPIWPTSRSAVRS
ncbi:hypothetical protein [Fodinicola feengrottensis]|uniref:hypothetical protein n=1 Tax=Fodinicola feengrottensis TaxID=435914 RepID=UPI002441E177|nr:hypothetical protein [Fodinicola feengrottensis]